ncbi:MAG: glycerol-3-phosphate acyltransferase [Eubacteriaceae bacterium]|nr:glycerol-3-phosphate acyltransferase [Eubacteriaceae bacterium]
MEYFIAAFIGYILGTFQTSYILGKLFRKDDIRKHGTHNAGASNATIVFGWKFGVVTAVLDILKAYAAVALAAKIFGAGTPFPVIAGFFAVIGHMFPFYMGFKGGKGLASYVGTVLALDLKIGIAMILIVLVMTIVTNYIFWGTIAITAGYPLWLILNLQRIDFQVLLFLMLFVIIFIKHTNNMMKIIRREEVGLRDLFKKKTSSEN